MTFGNPKPTKTTSAKLVLEINKLATNMLALEKRILLLEEDQFPIKNEQTHLRVDARRNQEAIAKLQRQSPRPG